MTPPSLLLSAARRTRQRPWSAVARSRSAASEWRLPIRGSARPTSGTERRGGERQPTCDYDPAGVMTERGGVGVRPGELLASGSRSSVFAWGRDAVVKVPFASTPEAWIHFEARYTAAVHDAGAPAPRFLGIETVNGRAASVYERVHGRSMWEHMRARPEQIPAYTRSLAELQAHLFSLVPPRVAARAARSADVQDPSSGGASRSGSRRRSRAGP